MRRYPLEPLADKMGVSKSQLARRLGLSGSTWKDYRDRGISDVVADRLAVKAGFHPFEVWPEMADDAVEDAHRECPECGTVFLPPHPKNPHQRFCQVSCRKRHWSRQKYATDPVFREKKKAAAAAYYEECGDYVRARIRRAKRNAMTPTTLPQNERTVA